MKRFFTALASIALVSCVAQPALAGSDLFDIQTFTPSPGAKIEVKTNTWTGERTVDVTRANPATISIRSITYSASGELMFVALDSSKSEAYYSKARIRNRDDAINVVGSSSLINCRGGCTYSVGGGFILTPEQVDAATRNDDIEILLEGLGQTVVKFQRSDYDALMEVVDGLDG